VGEGGGGGGAHNLTSEWTVGVSPDGPREGNFLTDSENSAASQLLPIPATWLLRKKNFQIHPKITQIASAVSFNKYLNCTVQTRKGVRRVLIFRHGVRYAIKWG
jgi:hypothetical protein